MVCLRHDLYFIAKRFLTSSLFTLTYSLKIKRRPGNPRATYIDAVPPCFAAVKLPQNAVTGVIRNRLPVDGPAPRPCSSAFPVPPPTFRGSLTGKRQRTLLFFAFLQISSLLYPQMRRFVNSYSGKSGTGGVLGLQWSRKLYIIGLSQS